MARRHRVERTFHHGEILQLKRYTLGLQSSRERHIEVLHTQHEAHRATQAAGVVVDIILHHIIVGHLDGGGKTTQTVFVHFGSDIDICHVGETMESTTIYFLTYHVLSCASTF